jgi:hypothetical protein
MDSSQVMECTILRTNYTPKGNIGGSAAEIPMDSRSKTKTVKEESSNPFGDSSKIADEDPEDDQKGIPEELLTIQADPTPTASSTATHSKKNSIQERRNFLWSPAQRIFPSC